MMLSDVCLTTSVAYIANIHGTHSYWKQNALGAAVSGVRRVWAGAGAQCAA